MSISSVSSSLLLAKDTKSDISSFTKKQSAPVPTSKMSLA